MKLFSIKKKEYKKGYKVLGQFRQSIHGNAMIYELCKEYNHDGEIKCRESGFHYFDSLEDAMIMYDLTNTRVFECILEGDKFEHDKYIHCTNKIKLKREVSQKEITEYVKNNLDKLVKSKYDGVRREVASRGFALEQLINDKDISVRIYARVKMGIYK